MCSLPSATEAAAISGSVGAVKTPITSGETQFSCPLATLPQSSVALTAMEALANMAREVIDDAFVTRSVGSSDPAPLDRSYGNSNQQRGLQPPVEIVQHNHRRVSTFSEHMARRRRGESEGDSSIAFARCSHRLDDAAVTLLLSMAVLRESLHLLLEVIFLLSEAGAAQDEIASSSSSLEIKIVPTAKEFVARLLGVSSHRPESYCTPAEGQSLCAQADKPSATAPCSGQPGKSLQAFFDSVGCADVLVADQQRLDLFGRLDWRTDSTLNVGGRQAAALLAAVGDIAEATGPVFRIVDNVDFDMLLTVVERGAVALHRLSSHSGASRTQPGAAQQDIHMCAAALKIIYWNLTHLISGITDKNVLAALLSSTSPEESWVDRELPDTSSFISSLSCNDTSDSVRPCPPPTYRYKLRRAVDLIVSNPSIDPDVSPIGAMAVQCATLRDVLVPEAAEQFSIICTLLEKSDSGESTLCERALVIKLMEGMEGPKLLQLIKPSSFTPGSGDEASGGAEDGAVAGNSERFVRSMLLLADRALRGKFRNLRSFIIDRIPKSLPQQSVHESSRASTQELQEGILRVLEPIAMQTLSALAHAVNILDGIDRLRAVDSILSIVEHIVDSARGTIDTFADALEVVGLENVVDADDISSATASRVQDSALEQNRELYIALEKEISRSHLASLVPLTLFAVSVLWQSLLFKDQGGSCRQFLQLFEPLCALVNSLRRVESVTERFRGSESTEREEGAEVALALTAALAAAPLCVTVWDTALSNSSLEFTEQNRSCRRPGSASCYPAAFAALPASKCVFSVTLTHTNSQNVNWLSVGVCGVGFATSSTDGFGRSAKSW